MEEIDRSVFKEEHTHGRKLVALLSWFIVLFIPTYAEVFTKNLSGSITEISYMWPWMVLVHLVPNEAYASDQYVVSGFPWTFIYFLPFLYVIKLNWNLYNSNEDRIKRTVFSAIAGLIQIVVIAITFESQEQKPTVTEEKSIIYIPQLILIEVHLIYAVIWYFQEMRVATAVSKRKKEQ